MYAASARQLSDAKDKNIRGHVLREFVGKMRDRVPSFDEFNGNFQEILYTSGHTKQRALVRYLLCRFDQYWRGSGSMADYGAYTIEHIAPEANTDPWNMLESHIGMIGNLIAVTERTNDRLGDRSFSAKKKILTADAVPMDDALRKAEVWDEAAIEARTEALSRLAYDTVFKM